MRFEDIPGISRAWLDFLKSGLPEFAVPATIQELAARAATLPGEKANPELLRRMAAGEVPSLSESIGRLGRPDAVVVSARLYSSLLGGPGAQLLKCLTAIKLCEQLRACSVNAVPVAWIDSSVPPDFPGRAVTLVDDGESVSLGISAGEVVPDAIIERIAQLESFGRGAFDTEVLDAIKKSFAPGRSLASATAGLYSALFQQWGMILVDPADFRSAASSGETRDPAAWLPVLACVLDPFEISGSQADESRGKAPMVAWPQASATIGDIRARRTFDRYHLDLKQLYEGEDAVLGYISGGLPRASLGKLSELQQEVESRIGELRTLVSNDGDFAKRADAAQEKILFQLGKLRGHCGAALNSKEQAAARRIHSACVLLAPNGRIQEWEIGAVQIPLRYSQRGLNTLYGQIDLMRFEHQLIWME